MCQIGIKSYVVDLYYYHKFVCRQYINLPKSWFSSINEFFLKKNHSCYITCGWMWFKYGNNEYALVDTGSWGRKLFGTMRVL